MKTELFELILEKQETIKKLQREVQTLLHVYRCVPNDEEEEKDGVDQR